MKPQVVLLTGATGQLGSAFAQRMLAAGHRLAVAVRRPWQVEKVRAALVAADGVADSAVAADRLLIGVVGPQDSEAAAGFVKGANDALGSVTAFVSTAGAFREAAVGTEPAGELQELLEANLVSGATLVRAVLPGMRRRGRGSITFVGSAGVGVADLSPNYLASKAALHEYVRALDGTLRGSGVRAAAIVPGTIDTPAMVEAALQALAHCAFELPATAGPLYPLPASD